MHKKIIRVGVFFAEIREMRENVQNLFCSSLYKALSSLISSVAGTKKNFKKKSNLLIQNVFIIQIVDEILKPEGQIAVYSNFLHKTIIQVLLRPCFEPDSPGEKLISFRLL